MIVGTLDSFLCAANAAIVGIAVLLGSECTEVYSEKAVVCGLEDWHDAQIRDQRTNRCRAKSPDNVSHDTPSCQLKCCGQNSSVNAGFPGSFDLPYRCSGRGNSFNILSIKA